MRDLYDTLGIAADASPQAIKKAYRTLALDVHPDKGGDALRMSLVNEAYQTLSDPARRNAFDVNWRAYQEADGGRPPELEPTGHLQAGHAIAYSQAFRAQHQSLVRQYEQTPLIKNAIADVIQPFESGLYSMQTEDDERRLYHDIYTFIQAKESLKTDTAIPTEPLTPVMAIKLLMDFLSGSYCGANLSSLKQNLTAGIVHIKSIMPDAAELLLYEGVAEIISMTNGHSNLIK